MKQTPIQADDYLCDEHMNKHKAKSSNRLNELVGTYATLCGNKEPVGLDSHNNKTNAEWREDIVKSIPNKKTVNVQ